MKGEDLAEAIFGGFDGATSAVGALAGLVLAHASMHALLVTGGGLAAAAAVGMGAGQYLSDEKPGGRIHRAAIMAGATFGGTMLPILPIALVGGWGGTAVAILAMVAFTGAIAEGRARQAGRLRAYVTSFGLMAGASSAAAIVAIVLGAV